MTATDQDLIALMLNMRQLRDFTGDAIAQEDLDTILEVARWTGSGKNRQGWRFLLIQDRDLLERLSVFQFHTWIKNGAFLLAVLTPATDLEFGRFDAGRVLERVMLAATSLGYGAGIISWQERDYVAVRELLNIPDEWAFFGAVSVGPLSESGGPLKLGGRKPLTETLVHDRFPVP
jgi:nitroreductase